MKCGVRTHVCGPRVPPCLGKVAEYLVRAHVSMLRYACLTAAWSMHMCQPQSYKHYAIPTGKHLVRMRLFCVFAFLVSLITRDTELLRTNSGLWPLNIVTVLLTDTDIPSEMQLSKPTKLMTADLCVVTYFMLLSVMVEIYNTRGYCS